MFIVGVIVAALGLLMTVLVFTGFIAAVPGLAGVADAVPVAAWLGIAVIGAIVAMMTRRARD